MSVGDKWILPGGDEGIEMPGSCREYLRVARLVSGWPYPEPPRQVDRAMCHRAPSRYLHGDLPEGDQ